MSALSSPSRHGLVALRRMRRMRMSSAESPREVPARRCDNCSAPMEYKGNLPATRTKKGRKGFPMLPMLLL
jgi:hypothetical protein